MPLYKAGHTESAPYTIRSGLHPGLKRGSIGSLRPATRREGHAEGLCIGHARGCLLQILVMFPGCRTRSLARVSRPCSRVPPAFCSRVPFPLTHGRLCGCADINEDVVRELIGLETLVVKRLFVSNCNLNVTVRSLTTVPVVVTIDEIDVVLAVRPSPHPRPAHAARLITASRANAPPPPRFAGKQAPDSTAKRHAKDPEEDVRSGEKPQDRKVTAHG